MRVLAIAVITVAIPSTAPAQEDPPAGFAELELARSRTCVTSLARLAELNARLQPLAVRFERLVRIARAVALEDEAVLDSIPAGARSADSVAAVDPVEDSVRAWFRSDGELARRYLAERDEALNRQRAAARERVKTLVQGSADSVRAQADQEMAANADVQAAAAPCQGAVFVRSAVQEVCASQAGPVCAGASAAEPGGRFRFVESPDDLWDIQELRPWSDPGPLQVAVNGQLAGARTEAVTRNGNVVLVVALVPLIQERAQLAEEEITRIETVIDSLGFSFEHPRVVFSPALEMQANLPEPLGGEDLYILHFGEVTEPDVLWSGPAGSGAPIRAGVLPTPANLAKLRSGEPLSLTAVRTIAEGEAEAVFSFGLTTVGQSSATTRLLSYMAERLSEDFKRLVPSTGG